jgi:putative flippase GtrA
MKHKQHSQPFSTAFIQFIKFNIVGIMNTAFTYGIYSLTVFLTNNHFLGVCVDYSIGICTSFVLNKHITFKNKEKITAKMVFTMILSYIPSFVLNLISLYVLIDRLHWNKYLAQLLTAFCIAYISFIIQKFFVFKTIK